MTNSEGYAFSKRTFTLIDAIFVTSSVFTFFTDIGTDVIVTIKYYNHGHTFWAIMTIGILVVPAPIIQFFSLRWCYADNFLTKQIWLWHLCGLGVLKRYIDILKTGFKMRRKKDMSEIGALLQQQSDVCMLRLFELFLESAPQIVLQLYIMVATNHWTPWTGISALASLISLSWGIASYSKAMRNVRIDKAGISWFGLTLQTIWRIGMITSRVTALVIFAVAFKLWIFVIMSAHWLAAFVWVSLQNTDFCANWWEERVYNCVVAGIYCFCFFNIKEGRTRYRLAIFYMIVIAQNIAFFLVSFIHLYSDDSQLKNHWLLQSAIAIIIGSFAIGLSTMILYYRYFHPGGPIPCPRFVCHEVAETRDIPKIHHEHHGSIAIRTMKSNRPSIISNKSTHVKDLRIETGHHDNKLPSIGKHHSVPCLTIHGQSQPFWKSMPNLIAASDIQESSEPCVNNVSQSESQESSLQYDSGVSDGNEEKAQPPNFDISLPIYEDLFVIQSPELKKIKSQLGHSISFGDIPLFPPPKRKVSKSAEYCDEKHSANQS